MKKTTIILFSFALLLIVAGGVLCFIGTGTGDVFDNTVVSSQPITTDINENVKTVVIKLNEVTVNVYGNYDINESYIETINVDEKQIKNSPSNELKITDQSDPLDLIIDTVKNFAGLRNIFFQEQVNTGAKTVNIYISKHDKVDLTTLTIEAEKGSVNINDMDSNTTYSITVNDIADSGKIELNNVHTDSLIDITADVGTVSVANTSANLITATLTEAAFHLTADNIEDYSYDLSTVDGTIYVLGDRTEATKKDDKMVYKKDAASEDYTEVKVSTGIGNIHIKNNDTESSESAPSEPETTESSEKEETE